MQFFHIHLLNLGFDDFIGKLLHFLILDIRIFTGEYS